MSYKIAKQTAEVNSIQLSFLSSILNYKDTKQIAYILYTSIFYESYIFYINYEHKIILFIKIMYSIKFESRMI